VEEIYVHPYYNSRTVNNDFALLRLSEPSTIEPVKWDKTGVSNTYINGKGLWVAGHGKDQFHNGVASSKLQHVMVPYVTNIDCTTVFNYMTGAITPNMLCAGMTDKDACQGDSGGPLYDAANDVVVGVVSWGEGCGKHGYPGVYARLSAQSGWIEKIIAMPDATSTPSIATPAPTPDPCQDSPLRIKFVFGGEKITRSCQWIENKPTYRCKEETVAGASKMCPLSCNTCSTCVDSDLRFKVTKDDGAIVTRSCVWVARAKNQRCKYYGVSDTCRLTCEKCVV